MTTFQMYINPIFLANVFVTFTESLMVYNPMPKGKSNDTLAEEFTVYFLEKIEKIRQQFLNINPFKPTPIDTPRL